MAVMSVMVDGLWGPEKKEYLLARLWVLENSKQEARFLFLPSFFFPLSTSGWSLSINWLVHQHGLLEPKKGLKESIRIGVSGSLIDEPANPTRRDASIFEQPVETKMIRMKSQCSDSPMGRIAKHSHVSFF
jgi:hypothetical protein